MHELFRHGIVSNILAVHFLTCWLFQANFKIFIVMFCLSNLPDLLHINVFNLLEYDAGAITEIDHPICIDRHPDSLFYTLKQPARLSYWLGRWISNLRCFSKKNKTFQTYRKMFFSKLIFLLDTCKTHKQNKIPKKELLTPLLKYFSYFTWKELFAFCPYI